MNSRNGTLPALPAIVDPPRTTLVKDWEVYLASVKSLPKGFQGVDRIIAGAEDGLRLAKHYARQTAGKHPGSD